MPTLGSFDVIVATNTTSAISTIVGVPVTIPNTEISNGIPAQVTVTASIIPSIMKHSGLYSFKMSRISLTAGGQPYVQLTGLESFVTPATQYIK
jgi:hypothetical protein